MKRATTVKKEKTRFVRETSNRKQEEKAYVQAWRTGCLKANPTPFPLIQKRQSKPHPPIKSLEDGKIPEDVFQLNLIETRREIENLKHEALTKGSLQAVNMLVQTAFDSVQAVTAIADEWPELLRPISRQQIMWPALIGKKKALSGAKKRDCEPSKNDWLIDVLELGKESPHRGQWNPRRPATQTAIVMHSWLEENKLALILPDLTNKTKGIWFEAGWRGLLARTEGTPEKDKLLRTIGQHYGSHSKNTGAQKAVTKKTRESNIRAGIRKQIRQSFMGYLAGLAKD